MPVLSRSLLLFMGLGLIHVDTLFAETVTYQFEARVNFTIDSLFGLPAPAIGSTFTGRLTYDKDASRTDSTYFWIDNLGAQSLLSIDLGERTISTVPGELDAANEWGWVEFANAEGLDFPEDLLLDGSLATTDGYCFLALVTDTYPVPDGSLDFPLDPLSKWDSTMLSPYVAIGDNLGGGYVAGTIVSLTKVESSNSPPEVACAVAASTLLPSSSVLVDVGLTCDVNDDGAAAPEVDVFVYSNESGQDDVRFDAEGLELRSRRRGDGSGRVYLIVVVATDAEGAAGYDCCTVVVPHDASPAAEVAVASAAVLAELACHEDGVPPEGYALIGSFSVP